MEKPVCIGWFKTVGSGEGVCHRNVGPEAQLRALHLRGSGIHEFLHSLGDVLSGFCWNGSDVCTWQSATRFPESESLYFKEQHCG